MALGSHGGSVCVRQSIRIWSRVSEYSVGKDSETCFIITSVAAFSTESAACPSFEEPQTPQFC